MHKNNIQYPLVIIIFFIITLASCERVRDEPLSDPGYFMDSELLVSLDKDEISILMNDYSDLIPFASLLIRYNIRVYKITYKTIDTDNKPVTASGALVVPENKNPMSLVSFQHGTIREEKDAPSNFSTDQYLNAILSASSGNITVLPDYLGYGNSRQLNHPYEHGRSLATSARDMLRALREYDLLNDDFRANNKLFLSGYSEGGYATMALLKLLEEHHKDEFQVTAATVGAGAYNKSEFARFVLESNVELTHLNSFLWVLETYNEVYGINRPFSHYFNEPYAGIISAGGVFANPQLNPQLLFKSKFREDILNGTDTLFINALTDNDNFDWKPATPLQLYHGTDDNFVFYFNSSSAYEAMGKRSAPSVELISVQGGTHSNTINDYFSGTFLFFSTF